MERVVRGHPPRTRGPGEERAESGDGEKEVRAEKHPPTFTGSRKAPDQPIFRGGDYRVFLTKYHRWAMLAGVDHAGDDVRRTWFIP